MFGIEIKHPLSNIIFPIVNPQYILIKLPHRHPDNVKALISAGILLNTPGSNKDVLNLFTTTSSNLLPKM